MTTTGTKATAKKTPAKAAPRKAPAAPPPAADPPAAPAPAPLGGIKTITFRDRDMRVAMPTAEALAVWKRTADRMAAFDRASADNAAAVALLSRAIAVVTSVLVDEHDLGWVEDEMLAGRLDLVQAADIMSLAVSAYGATAPTTGPAPKARRRA